jgi:hypothetical protein
MSNGVPNLPDVTTPSLKDVVLAHQECITRQVTRAGQLYKTIMLNAYQGTASPRSAIKAQCLICVGYNRDAITHCTGYSCPLWAYRPYQIGGGAPCRPE